MTVEIDMPMYNKLIGKPFAKHTQVIAFANCSLSTKPHCTQNLNRALEKIKKIITSNKNGRTDENILAELNAIQAKLPECVICFAKDRPLQRSRSAAWCSF